MKFDDRGAVLRCYLELVVPLFIASGFQPEMDWVDDEVHGWPLIRQTRFEDEIRVALVALVIKRDFLQWDVFDHGLYSAFRQTRINADQAATAHVLQPLAELF